MSSPYAKPSERSANIFINYRREDSAGHAGRLFDALNSYFAGRLFMDIDTLDPGTDFFEAIGQAVGSCEALIVVIGEEWLTLENGAGHRRLDDPGDFVRLEIESALARRIRIIPVLVQDAPMPRAEELPASIAKLARRHAIELSDARWAYDVDRLARTIRVILEESRGSERLPVPEPEKAARGIALRVSLIALGALVLVASGVLASLAWRRQEVVPSARVTVSPVPPADVKTVSVSAGDLAIGGSASPATAATAGADVSGGVGAPDGNGTSLAGYVVPTPSGVDAEEPPAEEPARRVEPPANRRTEAEPPRAPTRVEPDPVPSPTATTLTIPFDDEPSPTLVAAEPPVASTPAASRLPARATILSPLDREAVGSDILVQGVVSGLGDQQIFLGIRQTNGRIYPRGELFPNADGLWSIKLRSSKEKTFDILVVTSISKEASQVLRDQRSRDDGLSVLPEGASIGSDVVALRRRGKLSNILRPG